MEGVCEKSSEVNMLIQENGINSRIAIGVDWRIILRWIFNNWFGGGAWTGLIWLRIGTGLGHL